MISVFHVVCPVVDHEFCHNIVAVDPQGNSQVESQTSCPTATRKIELKCLHVSVDDHVPFINYHLQNVRNYHVFLISKPTLVTNNNKHACASK